MSLINLKPTTFFLFSLVVVVLINILGSTSPSPSSPSILDWTTNYLERYGYLEHARLNKYEQGSNITELEAAIKTFQENYQLKPTGIIDDDTLAAMKVPRCGVPDIINGTNMMRLHLHPHATNDNQKWHTFKLAYTLMGRSFGEASLGLARAFSEWQSNSDFIFSDTQGDEYLTLSFQRLEHGDGLPFDGPGGELAHSWFPDIGISHFDADEPWSFNNDNGTPKDAVDFESVALHEIGHLLGLHHSLNPSAVMYPVIAKGQTKNLLEDDDINALHHLYYG